MFTRVMAFFASCAVLAEASTVESVGSIFVSSEKVTPESQIDQIVFAEMARSKIEPVLCSDAVFVRRAFLDLIGKLPTAKEARGFIEDSDTKNKRARLIDHLLARDEFAEYWAMKWGDLLRIKAEFPINLWPNAAQAYHRWVRASIAANKPYDRFVRELLTGSGSNFRVGQVNFYRAVQNRTPEGIASVVALTFMGARAEAWPSNRLAGMSAFFSQIGFKPTSEWKEEHVFWDPLRCSTAPGYAAPGRAAVTAIGSNNVALALLRAGPAVGSLPDGTTVELLPDRDPRDVFGAWLVNPTNPWFTRSIVNRVWAWHFGRGIIHPADDIRNDNQPANAALLELLETEMIAGGYDMKRMHRLILNSKTYQLSPMLSAEGHFAVYGLRRLDAEVLIDAINQITGSSDLYTSPIPEPYTYIPESMPAVAIADGSITSPFLALFGRSARATGMENERNNKPTAAQWLHLLNSSHIQRKLDRGPRLAPLFDSGAGESEIVTELYLTVLSRFPTPDELEITKQYGGSANRKKRREEWVDLTWALINSAEFLYRH